MSKNDFPVYTPPGSPNYNELLKALKTDDSITKALADIELIKKHIDDHKSKLIDLKVILEEEYKERVLAIGGIRSQQSFILEALKLNANSCRTLSIALLCVALSSACAVILYYL